MSIKFTNTTISHPPRRSSSSFLFVAATVFLLQNAVVCNGRRLRKTLVVDESATRVEYQIKNLRGNDHTVSLDTTAETNAENAGQKTRLAQIQGEGFSNRNEKEIIMSVAEDEDSRKLSSSSYKWYVDWQTHQCVQNCKIKTSNRSNPTSSCGGRRSLPTEDFFDSSHKCCDEMLSWLPFPECMRGNNRNSNRSGNQEDKEGRIKTARAYTIRQQDTNDINERCPEPYRTSITYAALDTVTLGDKMYQCKAGTNLWQWCNTFAPDYKVGSGASQSSQSHVVHRTNNDLGWTLLGNCNDNNGFEYRVVQKKAHTTTVRGSGNINKKNKDRDCTGCDDNGRSGNKIRMRNKNKQDVKEGNINRSAYGVMETIAKTTPSGNRNRNKNGNKNKNQEQQYFQGQEVFALPATDIVYIDRRNSNKSYNKETLQYDHDNVEGLIRFDLSDVNDDIRLLDTATLQLYPTEQCSGCMNIEVVVANGRDTNDEDWSEEKISWNTAPRQKGPKSAQPAGIAAPMKKNSWVDIDVTNAVEWSSKVQRKSYVIFRLSSATDDGSCGLANGVYRGGKYAPSLELQIRRKDSQHVQTQKKKQTSPRKRKNTGKGNQNRDTYEKRNKNQELQSSQGQEVLVLHANDIVYIDRRESKKNSNKVALYRDDSKVEAIIRFELSAIYKGSSLLDKATLQLYTIEQCSDSMKIEVLLTNGGEYYDEDWSGENIMGPNSAQIAGIAAPMKKNSWVDIDVTNAVEWSSNARRKSHVIFRLSSTTGDGLCTVASGDYRGGKYAPSLELQNRQKDSQSVQRQKKQQTPPRKRENPRSGNHNREKNRKKNGEKNKIKQRQSPQGKEVFDLYATDVVYIDRRKPNTNFNELQHDHDKVEGLIRFDLSASYKDTSMLDKATLQLYPIDQCSDSMSIEVIVATGNDNDGDWSEEKITWNTAPRQKGPRSAQPAEIAARIKKDTWFDIDVTNAVEWSTKVQRKSYVIFRLSSSTRDGLCALASGDYRGGKYAPLLELQNRQEGRQNVEMQKKQQTPPRKRPQKKNKKPKRVAKPRSRNDTKYSAFVARSDGNEGDSCNIKRYLDGIEECVRGLKCYDPNGANSGFGTCQWIEKFARKNQLCDDSFGGDACVDTDWECLGVDGSELRRVGTNTGICGPSPSYVTTATTTTAARREGDLCRIKRYLGGERECAGGLVCYNPDGSTFGPGTCTRVDEFAGRNQLCNASSGVNACAGADYDCHGTNGVELGGVGTGVCIRTRPVNSINTGFHQSTNLGGWFVDHSLGSQGQCVQSCNGEFSEGRNCGRLASVWEQMFTSMEACCEQKLWWMHMSQCVPGL